MSAKGLYSVLQEGVGSNQRLSAFYDFNYSSDEIDILGAGSDFTGVLLNHELVNQPSLHTGYVLGSYESSEIDANNNLQTLLANDKLILTSGNLRIPLDGLNANNISVLIDFEFLDGKIDDGIIMGCFKTGKETIESFEIGTSEGFNVGITDRGHLFCQTFDSDGYSIEVEHSIELSKRNLIAVSAGESFITVNYFDYLNNLVKTMDMPASNQFISANSFLTFGGSDTYFRSIDNETATLSGSLNNLAIFSGYIGEEFLKDLGEGLIGDYSFTSGSTLIEERVTGYSETIVYKTGVTGYDYYSTGTLEIITGREEFTGSINSSSSESREEGERYYKYYTLNNGNVKTFYKEELGKLHSDSGYVYYPTGEDAYDTLGLNDVSESISMYTEVTGMTQDKITINLYGKTPLTGTLSEISGVTQTALTESYVTTSAASSGVTLQGDSEDLKKDYIYYMGGRS